MRFFDLHCDTLYESTIKDKNLLINDLHISLERGRDLSEWTQCFAVWIPDDVRGDEARTLFDRCISRFSSMKDITMKQKFVPLLTVEGGAVLAGDLKYIDYLKSCGVRAMTLTWNGSCEIGDGIGVEHPNGITEFGRLSVQRMQELGIAVDVSHASEPLFWDVMEITKKPIIATHSNARKVCSHKRNLTDEQINAIKSTGGVVGLTFCDVFLKDGGGSSILDVLKQAEHFLSLGMEDSLCIGSDFDGAEVPSDISGIESIKKIYESFSKINYSSELIDKILYKNAHDFFSHAKKVDKKKSNCSNG